MSEKSINSDGSSESNKDIDLNNTNNTSTNVTDDGNAPKTGQHKHENEISPESSNKNDKENKPIDNTNDLTKDDKSNSDKDSKKKSTKSASGTSTPVKRSKSFTGCYTCRRRKIGCDLGRPSCNRCLKSGFICEGYHVKLRWSNPIRFDKYGYQLPNNQNNQEQMEYSQRRRLDFVKYPKDQVYEMYDEMDTDLSSLHNENIKDLNQNIRLLGPFGVFRGEKLDESKFKRRRRNLKNLKNKNDTNNINNNTNNDTSMKISKSSNSINNTSNTNGISTNNTSY
ncbi:unnamed protein product [[Candida] boidinii]|nr:unnamed protein product [[Candida] boidinii]